MYALSSLRSSGRAAHSRNHSPTSVQWSTTGSSAHFTRAASSSSADNPVNSASKIDQLLN